MVLVETKNRGFSLIELLVVIAIISLLAAIIFPVFASVKENGRQSTAISNMHDISTKLELYKLDTHSYPPVLFGYAPYNVSGSTITPVANVSIDQVLDYCQANPTTNPTATQNNCSNLLPGLYPEYINNVSEFEDPNNTSGLTDAPVSAPVTYLCSEPSDPNDPTDCTSTTAAGTLVNKTVIPGPSTGASLVTGNPFFYKADAFDFNARVDSKNTIETDSSTGVYLPRYQTSWTSINGTLDCGNAGTTTGDANAVTDQLCTPPPGTSVASNRYLDQLRWRNPPAGTYVTCTTYHVPQSGMVLVLTQSGSVLRVDAARFASYEYTNPSSVAIANQPAGCTAGSPVNCLAVDNSGVDVAGMWRSTE